jgi:mRNA-degrading endonuclease RelE of RelBE toxin-antitoxin system
MRHFASPAFWKCYHRLPKGVQEQADKAFALLKENPRHSSLRFERKGKGWSARVSRGYRALAKEREQGLVWFWIGPHDEYERLIAG